MTREIPWSEALAAGTDAARKGAGAFDLPQLAREQERDDSGTVTVVCEVLRKLRAFAEDGRGSTLEEAMQRAEIAPQYRKLFKRWVFDLEGLGLLAASDGRYRWAGGGRAGMRAPHQDEVVEIVVTALTGRRHILEYVFGDLRPEWFGEYTESTYRSAPIFAYLHSIVEDIFGELGRCGTTSDPLRVFEVGAGMGGLTSSLLPRLPEDRSLYFFTDVGPDFVRAAKDKFVERQSSMRYRQYDINTPPERQGLELGRFDVVVAFDVLHCARDLGQTLKWLRSLLRPGGIFLNEQLLKHRLAYLIIPGLMPGYTDFEDFRTADCNTLISPSAWCDLLREAGYEMPSILPVEETVVEALGQGVVVARNPLGT